MPRPCLRRTRARLSGAPCSLLLQIVLDLPPGNALVPAHLPPDESVRRPRAVDDRALFADKCFPDLHSGQHRLLADREFHGRLRAIADRKLVGWRRRGGSRRGGGSWCWSWRGRKIEREGNAASGDKNLACGRRDAVENRSHGTPR